MITAQQAQLMADRGALLNDPDSLPQLRQAKEQGAAGLLPIYQKLSQEVAATSYANAFLVVAGLCAVGVLLALMLRSGPARPAAFPIAPAPAAPPEATAPLQPAAPPAPATPGRGAVTPVPERAKAQS
jgi:hypothetical protein